MQDNGSTAEAADATGLQSFSGLSLQEENDMRLEHALEILKADVSFALRSCGSQLSRQLSHISQDSLGNINDITSQSDMQLSLSCDFSFCFTAYAICCPGHLLHEISIYISGDAAGGEHW